MCNAYLMFYFHIKLHICTPEQNEKYLMSLSICHGALGLCENLFSVMLGSTRSIKWIKDFVNVNTKC